GRKHLLLDAADGQDVSAQGYLARHRNILPHRALREHGDHRRCKRDARTGAVLRDRAFGDVYVYVVLLEILFGDVEFARARLGVGVRGLRRLSHHLADLARQYEITLAARSQRLEEEHVAADGSPSKAGCDADLILLQNLFWKD